MFESKRNFCSPVTKRLYKHFFNQNLTISNKSKLNFIQNLWFSWKHLEKLLNKWKSDIQFYTKSPHKNFKKFFETRNNPLQEKPKFVKIVFFITKDFRNRILKETLTNKISDSILFEDFPETFKISMVETAMARLFLTT